MKRVLVLFTVIAVFTLMSCSVSRHFLTKVEAKESNCVEKGNIEYYSCSLCGKLFADSDGGRELSPSDVELPLSKDNHYLLEHVDAVKSTCNEKGNIEYWHCLGCENSYLDAECKEKVENVFLPLNSASHFARYYETIPATCKSTGVVAYWKCRDCGAAFADEECTKELKNIVIPIDDTRHLHYSDHILSKTTCTGTSTTEYWICRDCGKEFYDSALTQPIDEKDKVEYECEIIEGTVFVNKEERTYKLCDKHKVNHCDNKDNLSVIYEYIPAGFLVTKDSETGKIEAAFIDGYIKLTENTEDSPQNYGIRVKDGEMYVFNMGKGSLEALEVISEVKVGNIPLTAVENEDGTITIKGNIPIDGLGYFIIDNTPAVGSFVLKGSSSYAWNCTGFTNYLIGTWQDSTGGILRITGDKIEYTKTNSSSLYFPWSFNEDAWQGMIIIQETDTSKLYGENRWIFYDGMDKPPYIQWNNGTFGNSLNGFTIYYDHKVSK